MIINTKEYPCLKYGMIEKYGIKNQSNIIIEELSELTKAICKMKRGQADIDNIAEEIAHVLLTVQYLILYFEIDKKVEIEYKKAIQHIIELL